MECLVILRDDSLDIHQLYLAKIHPELPPKENSGLETCSTFHWGLFQHPQSSTPLLRLVTSTAGWRIGVECSPGNIEIQHPGIPNRYTCKLQIKYFTDVLVTWPEWNVILKWQNDEDVFFVLFFFRREIGPEFFPRCLLEVPQKLRQLPLLTAPTRTNFWRQFETISILGSTHQISI